MASDSALPLMRGVSAINLTFLPLIVVPVDVFVAVEPFEEDPNLKEAPASAPAPTPPPDASAVTTPSTLV